MSSVSDITPCSSVNSYEIPTWVYDTDSNNTDESKIDHSEEAIEFVRSSSNLARNLEIFPFYLLDDTLFADLVTLPVKSLRAEVSDSENSKKNKEIMTSTPASTNGWLNTGRTNPNATYVICKAEDRPKNDPKQIKILQTEAVTPLTTKFKFMSASMDKDNELVESYTLNTQIDALVTRCLKTDMLNAFDVFIKPIIKDSGGKPIMPSDPDDLKTFNLLTDTEVGGVNRVGTLEEARDICLFKRTFGEVFHVQNVSWGQEVMENSSEKELFLKVLEGLKEIPRSEQGAPVFFVLLKGLIQSNTESTVAILKKKLTDMKISNYPGENVRTVVSLIRGVLARLESVYAIPKDGDTTDPSYGDVVLKICKIMTTSSNEEFNSTFRSMIKFRRLGMPGADKKRNELLSLAQETYLDISAQSTGWLSADKTSAGFLAGQNCHNCDKPGHFKINCPDLKSTEGAPTDKASKIKWFRKAPTSGQPWTKTLDDGRITHWCPK